ncbi:MAG: RimK family alpha-L-glutamate ligase [Clostridia bacterium]|jgi:RimK family alpha-L-glutamate ligase|nr:RimK family alpha-L-glutamate ligase [Clostridia bacterium]MDH7572310.1 RimK family alpha-L-glutamate ligase [Clostridia bacterium]
MERPRVGILAGRNSREAGLLEEALRREEATVCRLSPRGFVSRVAAGTGGFVCRVEDLSGVALHELDALVVRSLPGGSLEQVVYRLDVLHQLEGDGVLVVNRPAVLEKTVDKFFTTFHLAGHGLPVPATVVVERFDQAMSAFEAMGRAVLKPLFGSRGVGMVLLEDPDIAYRVFRSLELGRYVYYLQQFLGHHKEDLRVFVLGGAVLAAMRRCSASWKSNLACGGWPEPADLDPRLAALAVDTARVLGADYLGVDLAVVEGSPYVIEANGIPGWVGLQSVAEPDIARAIAGHVLARIGGRKR